MQSSALQDSMQPPTHPGIISGKELDLLIKILVSQILRDLDQGGRDIKVDKGEYINIVGSFTIRVKHPSKFSEAWC